MEFLFYGRWRSNGVCGDTCAGDRVGWRACEGGSGQGRRVWNAGGVGVQPAALDPDLDVSPFQLKFGDILFNQEINKLSQLFLIHESVGSPGYSSIRSLVVGVRISCPESVTKTMSSIRTPPSSGM